MSHRFYAHGKTLPNGDPAPQHEWEPLFTPWHDRPGHDLPPDPAAACSGNHAALCPHCENLAPNHGHLNKVAHNNTPESRNAQSSPLDIPFS